MEILNYTFKCPVCGDYKETPANPEHLSMFTNKLCENCGQGRYRKTGSIMGQSFYDERDK